MTQCVTIRAHKRQETHEIYFTHVYLVECNSITRVAYSYEYYSEFHVEKFLFKKISRVFFLFFLNYTHDDTRRLQLRRVCRTPLTLLLLLLRITILRNVNRKSIFWLFFFSDGKKQSLTNACIGDEICTRVLRKV